MTKRLYLNDSYIKTATATVVACEQGEEGCYLVELDETPLYPVSGGQPHDTGSIGGIVVRDVVEQGDRVLHSTVAPLVVGEKVEARVDWPRRFDHMQQHCGEHLLSFAAHGLFGAVNVGFHMAESYCTVDFNMPFTEEQLLAIEEKTNAIIWENLPVEIQYVTEEELLSMALRKKAKELHGEIRIISMPGGDSCTCCGTHTKTTGEIGILKITGSEHYKGGERVTFACGGRALSHGQRMQQITSTLSRKYSCKPEDVLAAVEKQQQELAAAKGSLRKAVEKLLPYMAAELLAGALISGKTRLIVKLLDIEAGQLRPLAQKLCEGGNVLALLLSRQGATVQYVLCCAEGLPLDAGELAKAVNAALMGRGGGRNTLAQGSAGYTGGIMETLEQLERYLSQVLSAL